MFLDGPGFHGLNLNMADNYSRAEDQLFDCRDDACSRSDFGSDCSDSGLNSGVDNRALGYDFWTKEPDSVNERRERFLRWMGLSPDWHWTLEGEEEDSYQEDTGTDTDKLKDDGEAVLENFDTDPQFSSSNSLLSFSSHDTTHLLEDGNVEENMTLDEPGDDGSATPSLDLGSDKTISFDEFQKSLGSSSLVQQLLRKDCKGWNIIDLKEKANWLQRFNAITHIVDRAKMFLGKTEMEPCGPCPGSTTQRVRVSASNKNSKELLSLYTEQEFPAHQGSILTMKFCPDGMYLASAGMDGVVRVWKVLEDNFVNKFNTQDTNPSHIYFSLNHFSKFDALNIAKERNDNLGSLKKSSESAFVTLPPQGFKLSEKPLHEFHGHKGEVLALSWSKNGHLLSSSADKTARLWRVGYEHCLGVYSHNNFVTCVDFNPIDDNHFISGSIDGKLRIWEVHGGRVVDWTDLREIITAVVYRPDGKGGVVGTMDGTCQFYDIIDSRRQLGDSISLKGNKKLPGKRIVGFQYCPSDSSKVMVTSGDSQVQILCGTNIVCKFKGNRSSGSQTPATFTSDGEHIVSATEDSSVRIWNYSSRNPKKTSKPKKIWSYESFLSRNASIAIPWCGLKNKLGSIPGSILGNGLHFDEKLVQKFQATSLGCLLESLYKGSATWPEEKLPKSGKSEFKFLKHALSYSPNLWGLVIVTAGWDGRIRTFLNYGLPIKF